jgi:hypothetical protein
MAHLISKDNLFALYFVFCALCIVNVLNWFRIKLYVSSKHPKVWKRLGFWGGPWHVPASNKREEQRDDADRSLRIYLLKGHRQLNDAALSRMVRTQINLLRLGFLLIMILIVGTFAVTYNAHNV